MTQFFFKYSDFHFFFKHSSCLKFHFPISIPDLLQVNLANSVLAKVQRYLLYSIPVYFELPIFSAAIQSQVFYSATPPPSFLPSLSEDIPFVFRVEILKSSSAHSIWVVYFAIKKPPSPLWTWSRKLPLLCVRCHTWNLSSSLQHFKKKYAC